jgi:hypothetical protein
MGVLAGVRPVDPVVRGHRRRNAALLHGCPERLQVDLLERTLVNPHVDGAAPVLLVVDDVVLDAGLTGCAWIAWISGLTRRACRSGSSPKDSKVRPASGARAVPQRAGAATLLAMS